ncbi:MAG: hypothetical protein WC456_01890 [Patescibacteria group bacterium]
MAKKHQTAGNKKRCRRNVKKDQDADDRPLSQEDFENISGPELNEILENFAEEHNLISDDELLNGEILSEQEDGDEFD